MADLASRDAEAALAAASSIDRVPTLGLAFKGYDFVDSARNLREAWTRRFFRDGLTPGTALADRISRDFVVHDASRGRDALHDTCAALEALSKGLASQGVPVETFFEEIVETTSRSSEDLALGTSVAIARHLRSELPIEDWSRVQGEVCRRSRDFHALAGWTYWPERHVENIPELRDAVTRTIEGLVEDWLAAGLIEEVYDVGSGMCEEFAEEVAERLGVQPTIHDKRCPLTMVFTEDFCTDSGASRKLLEKAGEIVPDDVPWNRLRVLLQEATHQFVHFDGLYFDATAPEGVERFLDLPFFADQIQALRERHLTNTHRPM